MALRSPSVGAEEAVMDIDSIDTAPNPMLVDSGSCHIALDSPAMSSVCDLLEGGHVDRSSDIGICEHAESSVEAAHAVPIVGVGADPVSPQCAEFLLPSDPPARDTCLALSPKPRSTPPPAQSPSATGSGAACVTEGVTAVYQDFVDSKRLYYIFSRSRFAVDTHLSRHGVVVSPNLDVVARRRALVRHLVTGECFDFAAVRTRFGDGTEPGGCSFVANGSSSTRGLSGALLTLIMGSSVGEISNANLKFIALALELCDESVNSRKGLLDGFRAHLERGAVEGARIEMDDLERLKRPALASFATMHGIDAPNMDVESLRGAIWTHLMDGTCLEQQHYVGCETLVREEGGTTGDVSEDGSGSLRLQIALLEHAASRLSKNALRRVLSARHVAYEEGCPIRVLRKLLKAHISSLKKGKHTRRQLEACRGGPNRHSACDRWPAVVPEALKTKIVRLFKGETSSSALAEFTCACCAESCLIKVDNKVNRFVRLTTDFDLELLRRQPSDSGTRAIHLSGTDEGSRSMRMEVDDDAELGELEQDAPPMPIQSGLLCSYLIEPKGVLSTDDYRKVAQVQLCKTCDVSLKRHLLPRLAIANKLHLGPVPPELRDLTVVEEAMVSRCRAKAWIVQLKETDLALPNTQRGLKGNIIIYPQHPEGLMSILPPNIEDAMTPICVIFVGSSSPTKEWLEQHAKPLTVRKEKVRSALIWLKRHNPLYKDITIDASAADSLPENSILPYHIECQRPNGESDVLTSRYDANNVPIPRNCNDTPAIFDSVVISDVNVSSASSSELRAAALRHVKQKGAGFLQMPHDPVPSNEFYDPDLFPLMYPTLFPFGSGGFEDRSRGRPVSLKNQVKHYFRLSDRRFQEHYSFLFTAFNIIQRREALLRTKLRVDSSQFERVAADLADLPFEAVHAVAERVSRGDATTATDEDEKRVLRLMKEVRGVTSTVPGSSQARIEMRNEIRGLMMTHGMPSFYITINPADVFNPIVKFLAGAEIDIDNLLPDQVPDYWEQSILVARNPLVAARFFNIYMKAFVKTVLGYDPNRRASSPDGGVLGLVKAYYGCVEAQGRGTLHCHMMVWIEGALNPNEIRDRIVKDHDMDFAKRLLEMLDDAISTAIPPDPGPLGESGFDSFNPCSIRGPDKNDPHYDAKRKRDLHLLVKQCQSHSHTETCYKYWRGPPDPKECRLDLDESRFVAQSSVDMETGELCLRCLNGLVNNFNETIIEAVRCNMDIKFIGSGASAKAILYYITDYITKSQLKAHVAYAALELAVKKLAVSDLDEDDKTQRAKSLRLLQKCAYAMISHQELSAQQVASYLMGYEDHFTSHTYRNLNWYGAECLIDQQDPSPECKPSSNNSGLAGMLNDDASDLEDEDDELEADDADESCIDDMELGRDAMGLEVTIEALPSGSIVAKGGQLMDYQLRGMPFADLSLWDFIARVDKMRKSTRITDQEAPVGSTGDADGGATADDCEIDIEPLRKELSGANSDDLVPLLSAHPEAATHVLHLRKNTMYHVPVPVGPGSLPRRDREDVFQRYCRLMLVLFKPWRNARHLRKPGQVWSDAFLEFKACCDSRIVQIMNNMQLLHECRDSRDDHFAQRRSQNRNRGARISTELAHGSVSMEDDFFGESVESEILEHISKIEFSRSESLTFQSEGAVAAVKHALAGNLFDEAPAADLQCWALESTRGSAVEAVAGSDEDGLEAEWRNAYDRRRDEMKRKNRTYDEQSAGNVTDTPELPASHPTPRAQQPKVVSSIQDGEITASTALGSREWSGQQHAVSFHAENLIDEFTLNQEQSRAFRIISEHAQDRLKPPLQLYLGGAGGTGKSQVIRAVSAFFQRRNEARRFRVAAYTGVAARNIGGMTLHSSLSLNQRKKCKGESRTRRDLAAMWDGVDYLFIDEISMIGCRMLLDISNALCEATGKNRPFGGLSIILAGDFAQLPPVTETRLYAKLNTSNTAIPSYLKLGLRAGTSSGQRNVFGQLLWLGFKTVVMLHRPMRQVGPENEEFVNLLGRLREGRCIDSDYGLLNTRLLSACQDEIQSGFGRSVPIIVADNMSKDALNERAAIAFARSSGQVLHWYYATDSHRNKVIEDADLTRKLETLHSGKTSQRLGKIPLVIGMPVMITQNYDVEDGAVNGSRGILRRIRYRMDEHGKRHAISCVVEVEDYSGDPLPHLPRHFVPCLQDSVDIEFVHPYSKKKCRIRRTQVPLAPAFAITAHKSQGQTLSRVVIDLESSRSCESAYVMVSRVTSLQGLIVLRPFDSKRISSRMNQHLREEFKRLHVLDLETAAKYDSDEQQDSMIEGEHQTTPASTFLLVSHSTQSASVPIRLRKSNKRSRSAEQAQSPEPRSVRPCLR